MKIRRIQAHYVRIPFDMGAPLQDMGGMRFPSMDHLLVEVTTDTGVTGWGEGFGHSIIPATQAALETYVAPWFIGKDATDIEGLHRQAAQAFHIFGRNGPVVYAHAAIDIALWDIAGKRAGLPLYQLLGGASRTHVRAYASLLRYGKPETVARICADRVAQGFAHIKLHEHDTAAVMAARDGAGPDTALMNDVNCPWSVLDAIDMERAYRKANLYWLEEPVWPPEDHSGLAQVRRRAQTLIAAGENAAGLHDFRDLFEKGAVDIAQPRVQVHSALRLFRAGQSGVDPYRCGAWTGYPARKYLREPGGESVRRRDAGNQWHGGRSAIRRPRRRAGHGRGRQISPGAGLEHRVIGPDPSTLPAGRSRNLDGAVREPEPGLHFRDLGTADRNAMRSWTVELDDGAVAFLADKRHV
jgi:D-galactarolactone cycloisomerase